MHCSMCSWPTGLIGLEKLRLRRVATWLYGTDCLASTSPLPLPLSLYLSLSTVWQITERSQAQMTAEERKTEWERERLLQQLLLDTVLTDLRSFCCCCCCCWSCKVPLVCGAEKGKEGGANFNFVATCDLSQHMHTVNFSRTTTTASRWGHWFGQPLVRNTFPKTFLINSLITRVAWKKFHFQHEAAKATLRYLGPLQTIVSSDSHDFYCCGKLAKNNIYHCRRCEGRARRRRTIAIDSFEFGCKLKCIK